MDIQITTGLGEGPTPIAAFDAALLAAGVANYNLLYLSSVIPAGAAIRRARYLTPEDEYGFRLYVVMARQDAAVRGQCAVAGLGWTQEAATGRGLFVEVHGTEHGQVEREIDASLRSMIASRPLNYGPIESVVVGRECAGQPVCALALAVYRSAPWEAP
jgi:arginine decarboxylase